MNKIPERRKHVRIKTPYITRFRVKPYDDMVSKDLDTVAAFNLSAGGIFFYTKIDLGIGTIMYLKIGVSRSHPFIICVGKVIREKRYPAISVYGYSIEFTEINEQIKKMINKSSETIGWPRKL
jgi:c-di-GMP-binding flagellar brake protein YcgR